MTNGIFVRLAAATLLIAALVNSSGCMLMRGRSARQGPITPAPIVLNSQSSLNEVISAVHHNTSAVRQLQTTRARLSIPQSPDLRAKIALERPRRLRLIAEHALTGQELDLGSNDNMFWAWMKRTPVVYYGRHDQVERGMVRDVLPMPPDWLIEALGLVEFDPNARHAGPLVSKPGRLDVRSTIATAGGDLTKVTVVDDQRAWVLEQHVYDARGQLLAAAFASDHRFDALNGVSMPHRLQIQFPKSKVSFVLEVEEYLINQLVSDPAGLWSMPQPEGYAFQDITTLDFSRADARRSIAQRQLAPRRDDPLLYSPATADRYRGSNGEIRQARLRRLPPFSRIK